MKKILLGLLLFLSVSAQAANPVRRSFIEKDYTPNPSSTTAYTAGDALAGYSTLTGVSIDRPGYATLWGLTLTDSEAKFPDSDLMLIEKADLSVL